MVSGNRYYQIYDDILQILKGNSPSFDTKSTILLRMYLQCKRWKQSLDVKLCCLNCTAGAESHLYSVVRGYSRLSVESKYLGV